jgi:hypothetical protein
MRTAHLWMTVGLLGSALASAAACASFSSDGATPGGAADAAGVVPDGSPTLEAGEDAANAPDAAADGGCAPTFFTDFSKGLGVDWGSQPSTCTGWTMNFPATDGGGTCAVLTCAGSLNAYNVIDSKPPLTLDARMEFAFDVHIDGASPHTFAQLMNLFGAGRHLGFAADGKTVFVYDNSFGTTRLASWSWAPPPSVEFQHIAVRMMPPDSGAGDTVFEVTFDGKLQSFGRPIDVSGTGYQLQVGPFLNTIASPDGVTLDVRYTNVTLGSCH